MRQKHCREGSMGPSAYVRDGATETGTSPQDKMMTRESLSELHCESFQVSCWGAGGPWETGTLQAKGASGYRSMEVGRVLARSGRDPTVA